MRTNSIGWNRRIRSLKFDTATASTDTNNTELHVSGMEHLILGIQVSCAEDATAVITIQGRLRGTWTTIKTISLDEDSDAFGVYEIFEVGVYSGLRFSVNKTGNSVLNIIELSELTGNEPFTETDKTFSSSSPDEPLFSGIDV